MTPLSVKWNTDIYIRIHSSSIISVKKIQQRLGAITTWGSELKDGSIRKVEKHWHDQSSLNVTDEDTKIGQFPPNLQEGKSPNLQRRAVPLLVISMLSNPFLMSSLLTWIISLIYFTLTLTWKGNAMILMLLAIMRIKCANGT